MGWAADVSGKLTWGEADFSLKRGESPGLRFHNFNAWLREKLVPAVGGATGQCLADLVIYEMPHTRGGYATDVLVGMSTRIHEFCATHTRVGTSRPVDHEPVRSLTLKKWATGGGRASKGEMVDAALHTLIDLGIDHSGGPPLTDNIADALHLFWRGKSKHE